MVDLNPLHHSLNPLHYLHKLNEAIGHSTADVLEFIGVTDPAVDPDGIREMAKHWKDLAKDLSDASWHTMTALDGVQWEGKAAEAFAARAHQVRGHADKVCGILDKGEEALQHFADEAHELISEIGVIAAEIIEFEAAALALTLITGPIAEAAAAIASGERAMKIMALIARIEEAGRRMARILEALIESVGGLARALKALESIAKMALSGAGTALAWDALFDTERLKDPGAIKDDVEMGALLGIAFGSTGKLISELGKSIGPLGPALALAGKDGGAMADLSRLREMLGSKWDELQVLLRNFEDKWPRGGPKPPLAREIELAEEEAAGGHSIGKHVGKKDQDLRDRITKEGLDAASSFHSYTEAQKAVNDVMKDQKGKIETWLKSGKGVKQDFTSRFENAEIGKSITRDEMMMGIAPHPVDGVTIVIKRDPSAPEGYRILTAFPSP